MTTSTTPLARLVDVVVPRQLGTSFRWLLGSSWTTNLGDGLALAAGPLLVASQTDQPFLIALAALSVWAPPLVFGLVAGVVTDRLDRRRIVVVVNVIRALVLAALVVFVVTDWVSIALVLIVMFLLGTAEVFADSAASTLTPMLVTGDDLPITNSRIQAGFITVNQLAGPPLGAALFAAGHAWPFLAQTVLVLLGTLLVARVVVPAQAIERESFAALRHDIAEGVRWVRHHAAVRTLVLTILIFNVTFGAAWSVLVLYATEHLGLGEIGFGLVTTVGALGGLVGVLSYGWITRHVSLGDLMRIGLVIETLTHLGLALTSTPWIALSIFFVFGAHAFIWGTTSITIRQRAVPTELQGRVGSVNLVGVFGGLVVGSGIGGLLAQLGSVTTPFWFAFGGSAVFCVLIWRQLSHIAHAPESARTHADSA